MPTIDELLTAARRSLCDSEALARTGRELHDRNRLPAAREVLDRALERREGAESLLLETWLMNRVAVKQALNPEE